MSDLRYADEKGRIKLDDIVSYFRSYYEGRRAAGLKVEKSNSIFAKGGYTDKEAERNILPNPFKRFEDIQMLRHTKTLEIVQVDESVWKKLAVEDKEEIARMCDDKLSVYGEYLRTIKNALKFNDIVEAKEYIERRGIEKIAMTRRVRIA